MLKRFFLNTLSSFVGTWVAIVLFVVAGAIVTIGIAGGLAASSEVSNEVKKRSILVLDLDGVIEEREMPVEPSLSMLMNGKFEQPKTLDVITEAIREGAVNDNIVALYIKCGGLSAGPATLNAIRNEVMEFKKKGKIVVAYGNMLSQSCYYIASAADKVYMNPAGEISLSGLNSTGIYMKGLFDKLGIQFQVVKVGTYKSAVEPYILENMSAPARAQLDTLLSDMWGVIRSGIASSRKGLTPATIDSLISRDYISFARPQDAVKAGLVDSLIYERQMNARLAGIAGCDVEKINFVQPSALVAQTPWSDSYSSKKQIAVLFASGEIADGNNNAINYENLVPVIVKLADNEDVKGLVLRVNSPGGSVFGSDQIGEALDYFQSKGKPLAVSMGDYAASGGYWISACANRIFADPLTVTGSIGIFGLIPNVEGTLDKIGVNVETVSTNPGSDFPSLVTLMTPVQKEVLQKNVERGYDRFVARVAKGRNMSEAKVRHIGEGRVWSASSAVKLGLVDALGSLRDAVEWTASKAGIASNYDVAAYPKVEANFWNMIMSGGMTVAEINSAFGSGDEKMMKLYFVRRILSRQPLQARMPEYTITF